jgi:type II secretory pathway pseudopilin PulG
MTVMNDAPADTRERQPRLAVGGPSRGRRRGAFSLIELVVTLGVLTILLGITLPAVSSMLEGKNRAQIQNTVRGILRSARVRALNSRETGLFFFLDGDVQKAVFIEAEPVDKTDADGDGVPDQDVNVTDQAAADRFRVLPEEVFVFPPPFRVTPLDVLQKEDDNPTADYIWDDIELATERPSTRADGDLRYNVEGPRYHRNFCTIIFDAQGKLVVGRSVLIHDAPAPSTPPAKVFGLTTGLRLEPASKYQPQGNGPPNVAAVDLDTGSPGADVADLVFSKENGAGQPIALNFPSVDGVLLYDDSLFKELPGERREFIARTGQPMYISRQTGRVIAGPVGENDLAY